MPSFVLSSALLLLVLLTLLAVSNRELIALTFLGVSTVALPLSIWILGAIAVGFLLGVWILLLFRFGTVGAGSGSPFRDKRRANYGPEDFAVVDDRFAESQAAPVYRDGNYGDNRYDDIYGQGQYEERSGASSGASQRDTGGYASEQDYERQPVDGYGSDGYGADDYETGYDQGRYASSYESDSVEPQDRFSASAGYDNRTGSSGGSASSPSGTDGNKEPVSSPHAESSTNAPATDPAMPQDWDDQYREDWTQEELLPQPVLREQTAAPKLKRWLNPNGEERPLLNLGGFGLGGSKPEQGVDTRAQSAPVDADARRDDSLDYRADESDWQAAGGYDKTPSGDRRRYEPNPYDSIPEAGSREVYDADYRVIRKPEGESAAANPAPPEPETSRNPDSRPIREPEAQPESKMEPKQRDGSGKDDWDIDSDLGW